MIKCPMCGGVATEDDEWIMMNVCCECGYHWMEPSKEERDKRIEK